MIVIALCFLIVISFAVYQNLQLSALRRDHVELVTRFEDLSLSYLELDERHTALRQRHEDLKRSHVSLEGKLTTLDDKHTALEADHAVLKADFVSLSDSYTDLKESHGLLLERHGVLREDHDALREKHIALREDHNALRENYDALSESFAGMQEDFEWLKEQTGLVLLKRPTLEELRAFLREDRTNEHAYIDGEKLEYICTDFARDFRRNAIDHGYNVSWVSIYYTMPDGEEGAHAINAVYLADGTLVFIEPQDDGLHYELRVGGKFYWWDATIDKIYFIW